MAPDWIHFYGDLRLRLEDTMDQNAAGDDRLRGRMRARFGAKFDISEDLKAEVRLTTKTADARNVHWDIGAGGDGLVGADVGFDRINLTWMPCDEFTVKAGKFGNPMAVNPVYSEWTWDGDVQPGGIFGMWSAGGDLDMDVRLGYFVVDEVNSLPGGTADPAVTVAQFNFGMEGDDMDWGVHTSLWDWTNADAFTAPQAEDFLVWDTVLEAGMDDFVASLEYMSNLDDDSGDDTGYAVGLKYGKGGHQGDSVFAASYFDFDANAFVSAVAQDDTPIAGTGTGAGMDGFEANWNYWWKDNVMLRLWAISVDDGTNDPLRLRFDVNVSFKR